jgi:hypothetical protein
MERKLLENELNENELIQLFVSLGVKSEKIIITTLPSIAVYSLSRKCLVGEKNQPDPLELLEDNSLSYKNNRWVSLQMHDNLNVDEINNSNGIIVSNATDKKAGYYRYQFIPLN